MILWLSVIGSVLVIAVAATWMVQHVKGDHSASTDLDRDALPEDQLGL